MKRKFWSWVRNEAEEERILVLNGEISDETWYGDEVTLELFRKELDVGTGNITVWINSPGGDVFAAVQIYNMLMEYRGDVTVKADALAASAASVIAMAGTMVLMSPVAMMMIHNPMTIAIGDSKEMQKAGEMLDEVKESIMNAYEIKTGLNRTKISHLMDAESWFNSKKAVELGIVEMMLFSINPAFDLLPASEDLNEYFKETYAEQLSGIAAEREELYRICEREGVGITVMKGYAGGRLFQAETSPFGVALTPVQCLHYALTRPAVASVMAGFDTPEHVDAAVAYETATEEEKDYASVLASAPEHAYSGQCTYCGHCAPCPVRIDIAMVNKLYDLAAMQEEVPATVKAHYEQLSANAGDCVQCGGCESRCPFGVRIVDRMKKTRELFGAGE